MVKSRAIFCDRDGTLIKTKVKKNKPYAINDPKKLHIFKESYLVCNLLKTKYKLFITTNQPDVGKKQVKKKLVTHINNKIKKELKISKVYNCLCNSNKCKFKKPNSGMIKKATKEFNIDLKKATWLEIDGRI